MLVVLLPAYNEEQSLLSMLPKLGAFFKANLIDYRIIVGNDGSTDGTGEVAERFAKEMPLEVLTHRINRGLGETMRDLLERAIQICDDSDVIVRMDGDDTQSSETIGLMLEKIQQGSDVVIASRFAPGGGQKGVDWWRAFISRLANLFMKFFFPMRGVKEYSSGFRAYRASVIRRAIETYGNDFIQLRGLGFTCTLEKLVKLNLLGARFSEVPSVLRYDEKKSESKMVTSITTLGYVVMTVLYHWPWGGWRNKYRHLRKK